MSRDWGRSRRSLACAKIAACPLNKDEMTASLPLVASDVKALGILDRDMSENDCQKCGRRRCGKISGKPLQIRRMASLFCAPIYVFHSFSINH